nr:hypothetical protein [Tanacetum cinerariifolium]
ELCSRSLFSATAGLGRRL